MKGRGEGALSVASGVFESSQTVDCELSCRTHHSTCGQHTADCFSPLRRARHVQHMQAPSSCHVGTRPAVHAFRHTGLNPKP